MCKISSNWRDTLCGGSERSGFSAKTLAGSSFRPQESLPFAKTSAARRAFRAKSRRFPARFFKNTQISLECNFPNANFRERQAGDQ
jgi:hypothetical protein